MEDGDVEVVDEAMEDLDAMLVKVVVDVEVVAEEEDAGEARAVVVEEEKDVEGVDVERAEEGAPGTQVSMFETRPPFRHYRRGKFQWSICWISSFLLG